MEFWIIVGLMALLVTVALIRATARRRSSAEPAAAFDVQVYRDQLAEVDRDLARGVVNADDADRVRTEISRRILAADSATQDRVESADTARAHPFWWGLVTLIVLAGSVLTYMQLGAPGYGDLALQSRIDAAQTLRENRPSQETAEKSLPPDVQPGERATPEYAALVDQLRSVVAERPDDLQGLRLLAISERNLGNFDEAYWAFNRYIALRADEATGAEFSDLADMMILAAGGYVSPEAEQALAEALQREPTNGPARYYWGLMMAQNARPDQAFRIWDALLREGPPDAPWIPPIQAQIDEMSIRAGVNYTQPPPGGGLRGPSAEDVEAMSELSAAEQLERIQGMVAGLGERLANEGGTYQEWGQLITGLGVLGQFEDAQAVYQNALQVFAEDPNAIDFINRAGDRAGVAP